MVVMVAVGVAMVAVGVVAAAAAAAVVAAAAAAANRANLVGVDPLCHSPLQLGCRSLSPCMLVYIIGAAERHLRLK